MPPRTHAPALFEWQKDGVPLLEHLESRLSSLQTLMESRLAAIERATTVALAQLDRRLEGMNEFRDVLKDQTGRLATKDEVAAQLERVNVQIVELKEFRALLEGKASQSSVNVFMLMSALSLLVAFIGLALKFIGG
jgi:hypothetical protein